jgi:hypothetical protein
MLLAAQFNLPSTYTSTSSITRPNMKWARFAHDGGGGGTYRKQMRGKNMKGAKADTWRGRKCEVYEAFFAEFHAYFTLRVCELLLTISRNDFQFALLRQTLSLTTMFSSAISVSFFRVIKRHFAANFLQCSAQERSCHSF